jgi:hypothetical protein
MPHSNRKKPAVKVKYHFLGIALPFVMLITSQLTLIIQSV